MPKTKTEIVNVETGKKEKIKRETIITKSISRTIQTAPYFSLTIHHCAQDTIEWDTVEEREKKQHNLTKLAIKDFSQTHDTILKQLKLGENSAFGIDHIAKKASEKDPSLIDLEGLDDLE